MNKKTILFIWILIIALVGTVDGSVYLYDDVEVYAGGWTVTFLDDIIVEYFEVGVNYTNYSYNGVDFINNSFANYASSSESIVEQNNLYNLGTYNTTLTFGIYAPSDWTVSNVFLRLDTNTSIQLENISNPSYTQLNTTHRRYSYNYNPDNTDTIDWVMVQMDIWAKAYNDTLQYQGYREFDDVFEIYELDPPYAGGSVWDNHTQTVNLTWTSGNYSDYDVIIRRNDTYPTNPDDSDAYIVQNNTQNGTGNNYNVSLTTDAYYTVYSWNSTTHSWSGTEIPWGAIEINVFNASKTWQPVAEYGLKIQNVQGTTVYQNQKCTNTFYLDLYDGLPVGTDTVFIINSSGFITQTYRRDTTANQYHNYTFLLPPVETSTPGTGDEDPVTGDPTNATDSQLYLITVNDELGQAVPDALVEFNSYRNDTETYEQIGSFISDGNGQGTIWLVPNIESYQVIITADGYETSTQYWMPSNLLLVKTFQLQFEDVTPQPSQNQPTITATRTGEVITVTYDDPQEETTNTQLFIYVITTSGTTLVNTYNTTETQSWTHTEVNVNSSNDHEIIIRYNRTDYHNQSYYEIIERDYSGVTTVGKLDSLLDVLIGETFLAWSSILQILFVVAIFYYSDERDSAKMLIFLGGIFLFLDLFLHFDNVLLTAAGGVVPGLLILVGIIMMWQDSQKKEVN